MDYIIIFILGASVGVFIASLICADRKDNDEMIEEFKKRKKRDR